MVFVRRSRCLLRRCWRVILKPESLLAWTSWGYFLRGMALGGVGLGLGVKDYRVVMIFKSKVTLDKFVASGWDFGAHADAAAKAGETAGELSAEGDIISGIEVYSMTESGLALQATAAGTKYWKDKKLN